jgi:hypothetical protein
MELARSTHRYRSRGPEQDAALQVRLQELAAKRMRFGYRRLSAFRGNRYAWISGLKIFPPVEFGLLLSFLSPPSAK